MSIKELYCFFTNKLSFTIDTETYTYMAYYFNPNACFSQGPVRLVLGLQETSSTFFHIAEIKEKSRTPHIVNRGLVRGLGG